MSGEKITIRRAVHDKENPYAQILRATLQDRRISFEARGLLAYLLSKPTNWEVSIGDLMNEGDCGRDRIYRILRELQRAGYVQRNGVREHGRFVALRYEVSESPFTENPYTEKPYTENPQLHNKEKKQKKEEAAPRAKKRSATTPTPSPEIEAVKAHPLYQAYFAHSFPPSPVMTSNVAVYQETITALESVGITPAQIEAYVKAQPNAIPFQWLADRVQVIARNATSGGISTERAEWDKFFARTKNLNEVQS